MTATEKYRWIEYHKWTFKGNWYTSLAGNLVLVHQHRLGSWDTLTATLVLHLLKALTLGAMGCQVTIFTEGKQ
jgi:outer membrane protein insertion porin family